MAESAVAAMHAYNLRRGHRSTVAFDTAPEETTEDISDLEQDYVPRSGLQRIRKDSIYAKLMFREAEGARFTAAAARGLLSGGGSDCGGLLTASEERSWNSNYLKVGFLFSII